MTGCGPVPGPAIAVLSVLRLPFAREAWLCWPSQGSGRRAIWSLQGGVGFLPAVRCTPCVWGWGCMCLVPALGLYRWGCCACWCRAAACGCSPCFACYTPCGPGSGYAGVSWCLRFCTSRGHCCRYVVMGCGWVPVPPVVVVSLAPPSPPPCLGPGCVGGAGLMACAPLGRWFLVCAVYRVVGAWGECAWCMFAAPVAGAAEVIGVGRALSPLSGRCCCRRARRKRCGFPPGVVVLVLLLHHVLCLCCVCALSCVPCIWVLRCGMRVHLIWRVLTCACVPHTGLASGISLALGLGVSWVLPVNCSPLHKLRSLFQASEPVSHVESAKKKGSQTEDSCLETRSLRPAIQHAFALNGLATVNELSQELIIDHQLFLSHLLRHCESAARAELAKVERSEYLLLRSNGIPKCTLQLIQQQESHSRSEVLHQHMQSLSCTLSNIFTVQHALRASRLRKHESTEFSVICTNLQASCGSFCKEYLVDIFKDAERNAPFFQTIWCQSREQANMPKDPNRYSASFLPNYLRDSRQLPEHLALNLSPEPQMQTSAVVSYNAWTNHPFFF